MKSVFVGDVWPHPLALALAHTRPLLEVLHHPLVWGRTGAEYFFPQRFTGTLHKLSRFRDFWSMMAQGPNAFTILMKFGGYVMLVAFIIFV